MSDTANPVIMVQLLKQFHNAKSGNKRIFKFTKNNTLRIHKETDDEARSRKSVLPEKTLDLAENVIRSRLSEVLRGRLGKIWIEDSDRVKGLALNLQGSVGEGGYGTYPSGTRIPLPNGKKVRAFTYWEKVNDIDLSCFGLCEDGSQMEFSWRSMYCQQSNAVRFSGDQTDGYYGGSEFFDIDIDEFMKQYPNADYIVFCDNIYSDYGRIHFKNIEARAGFMNRDILDSGEVYEPKTVETSFRLTADGSFCYMFAIDLNTREIVWLNTQVNGNHAIAGESDMNFLKDILETTNVFSAYDLLEMSGTIVSSRTEADVIVTNELAYDSSGKNVIHLWDDDKFLGILQKA